MAYEYKLPLTYSVNNANNCTSLFSKYTHILLGWSEFTTRDSFINIILAIFLN